MLSTGEHRPGDGGSRRAVRGGLVSVAVASLGGDRARRFADDLGLELAFASYQALLECDGGRVYVALPISMHIEWTIKALRAGKHVLCEKLVRGQPGGCPRGLAMPGSARRGPDDRYHPQARLAQRLG